MIGKLSLKKRILSGFIFGLVYAITMAFFDYFTESPFNFGKFVFNGLFFGILMGFFIGFCGVKNKKKISKDVQ